LLVSVRNDAARRYVHTSRSLNGVISVKRRERILVVSVGADTLDIQDLGRRLRGVGHRLGECIVVMHWSSRHSLSLVPNEHGYIDVVQHRYGNRDTDWYSDGNIHGHRNGVGNHLRHSDRDSNGNLHVHGTFNRLLDDDLVRTRDIDGNRFWHTNLGINCNRMRNTHSLHFLDGNNHWSVLGDCVRRIHVDRPCLDHVDRDGDFDFLNHVLHHLVGLRDANLLWNGLWLINGNLDLVWHNLLDRHNHLDSPWDFDRNNNLYCLRDIDSLCLCDFNWVWNIHRDIDGHGNCDGPSHLDGLRYFNRNRDIVRTRNFDRHLIWDNHLVWDSHLLCHGHLDLHRDFNGHCVRNINCNRNPNRHCNRHCDWNCD